jgi:hypothetical protein
MTQKLLYSARDIEVWDYTYKSYALFVNNGSKSYDNWLSDSRNALPNPFLNYRGGRRSGWVVSKDHFPNLHMRMNSIDFTEVRPGERANGNKPKKYIRQNKRGEEEPKIEYEKVKIHEDANFEVWDYSYNSYAIFSKIGRVEVQDENASYNGSLKIDDVVRKGWVWKKSKQAELLYFLSTFGTQETVHEIVMIHEDDGLIIYHYTPELFLAQPKNGQLYDLGVEGVQVSEELNGWLWSVELKSELELFTWNYSHPSEKEADILTLISNLREQHLSESLASDITREASLEVRDDMVSYIKSPDFMYFTV